MAPLTTRRVLLVDLDNQIRQGEQSFEMIASGEGKVHLTT